MRQTLVIYREATALGVSDRMVQSSEKGFPRPWLHSQSSSYSSYGWLADFNEVKLRH
jgi:hypothetical protein